jgi:hypothetical protein
LLGVVAQKLKLPRCPLVTFSGISCQTTHQSPNSGSVTNYSPQNSKAQGIPFSTLVADDISGVNLFVWLLDTDITYDITLQCTVKYVTLCVDRIGIVTQRNVVIWRERESKSLQRLLRCFSHPEPMPEVLLFHPTTQNTLVLASRRTFSPTGFDKKFVMRIFLHEYVNGIMKNHIFIDIPYLTRPHSSTEVKFDVRAIDENGTYSICWVNAVAYDLGKVRQACKNKHCNGDAKFHHLLCYNVYEKELTIQCFTRGLATGDNTELRHPRQTVSSCSHVWAGQMLTPVISANLRCRRRFLFQTVVAHDRVSLEPPAINYIDAFERDKRVSSEDSLSHEQDRMDGLLSYFVYDLGNPTPYRSQEHYGAIPWCRLIRGDNEYLVLLAEQGYVAWCLEGDTVLPLANQSPRSIL